MDYQELGKEYIRIWRKNPENFMQAIATGASVRGVLLGVYAQLVATGECRPIEQLPISEKREIWEEAKRISGSTDKKLLTDICKALQGFGQFIQLHL